MKLLQNKMKYVYILLSIGAIAVLSFYFSNRSLDRIPDDSSPKIVKEKEVILEPAFPERIKFINPTFLGNFQRNFYGDSIPDNLIRNWRLELGEGKSKVGKDTSLWRGAGWTGQPLMIEEDNVLYVLQGAYDYNYRKINAETGTVIWQYKFDDIVKGTGTLWKNNSEKDSLELRYLILQGSRYGFDRSLRDRVIPSYRAISAMTGQEAWRLNVWATRSYSRDVDASAAYIGDTAYIGLENGYFISFLPHPKYTHKVHGIIQPSILDSSKLYSSKDIKSHGGNLVTEASPAILGNHVYIASGSGHVYGYNIDKKEIDWQFDVGSDLDGSPVVTNDSCLLISIEKQYIKGKGGILKLNPKKTGKAAVEWFFPVPNKNLAHWQGGVIGSVGVSDFYQKDSVNQIAAFNTIDGNFYVVMHTKIDKSIKVKDYNNKNEFYKPKELFSYKVGPSIATPIIIPPRILVAAYSGLYVFEYDKNYNFKLLAKAPGEFEATPFAYHGKVYIASRGGYLYCLGIEVSQAKNDTIQSN